MSAGNSAQQSWAAESETVPAARRFVRGFLLEQRLDALVEDAELLVTELAGNVVLHVGGTLTVRLLVDGGDLVLEVADESAVTPLLRAFSAASSTGRGMRLVHSLAATHGVRLHDDGKTVWVRLSAQTARRSEADLAEAFADIDWLAEVTDLTGADAAGDDGVRAAQARRLVRDLLPSAA